VIFESEAPAKGVGTFLVLFIGIYIVLYIAYMAIPDDVLRLTVFPAGIVRPTLAIINMLDNSAHAVSDASTLMSRNGNLDIVRGCDGSGIALLLTSGILAFPTSLRAKVKGLMVSLLLVVFTNCLRILGLYFALAYADNWFELLHLYIIPTLMVLLAGGYFIWWASRQGIDRTSFQSSS
jgi:exosortase family protein XrtM